ncbi:cupin domain-containing protein [Clostridium sp. C8-1-8]|uniref:cupin domain-containing protein n=1 Tax=Clostridium sp. C8-1-8 TaxID=2698831 RepID=UPI00136CB31E|nr:cupin domain-containing protein [Clostridium sp. C8-1-8]
MKIEKISDKIAFSESSITKKIIFKEDKLLSFVLNFKPGQGVPPHNHEQSDLLVHVLSGNGDMTVDGQLNNITAGDVIHCYGKEVFSIKNTSDKDMSLFIVLTPNPSAVYSKEI